MIYLFFRDTGFYPVDLPDDRTAIHNAEANPGTIYVKNEAMKIIWQAPPDLALRVAMAVFLLAYDVGVRHGTHVSTGERRRIDCNECAVAIAKTLRENFPPA